MTTEEIVAWLDEKILNHRFSELQHKIDKNSYEDDKDRYSKGLNAGYEMADRLFADELRSLKELINPKP